MRTGMVSLVGAGPGDPGYMTVRGMKRLRQCDVVIYDDLASDRLLDQVKEGCRKLYVGKRAGHHSMKQEEINRLLVEEAGKGFRVVRLKGGDPFVFGRGGEEVLALQAAGIPYEVVSGVTSAVAVPASAGIPVTHRGESRSFHVMTGHTKTDAGGLPPDFDAFARLSGTLVFLMGRGNLPMIVKGLLNNGKSGYTPVAVIEQGTTPQERSVKGTLSDIVQKAEEAKIGTPAVIVVGDTVSMSMKSTWSDPLDHIRVGVTGTGNFTKRLMEQLEDSGAETEEVFGLDLVDRLSEQAVRDTCGNPGKYDWIVFTSANAVRLYFQGLRLWGKDLRAMGHLKIAAVGSGTAAELDHYGFQADYVPETFCVEALALGLVKLADRESHMLIPRSSGGSAELNRILDEAQIRYDDIVLYDVVSRKQELKQSSLEKLDYLTFASASGVRSFFKAAADMEQDRLKGVSLVCIGDKTAEMLVKCGHKPDLVAEHFSIEGLMETICSDVRAKRCI